MMRDFVILNSGWKGKEGMARTAAGFGIESEGLGMAMAGRKLDLDTPNAVMKKQNPPNAKAYLQKKLALY